LHLRLGPGFFIGLHPFSTSLAKHVDFYMNCFVGWHHFNLTQIVIFPTCSFSDHSTSQGAEIIQQQLRMLACMLGFTQPHLDDLPLSEALASGQKMSNLMALCLKPVAVCKLPLLKNVFNHFSTGGAAGWMQAQVC
jgi:hypothetical protein